MSIALMTLAWKADCASGKKMVLLALCDNANDQGECYPSVSMLATKCSMSERSVFKHIAELESDGAIRRENRNGRSTIYHLDHCKFCTPANSAPITINEPSIEPSSNQIQKPVGVSDGVWQDFKSLRKEKKAKLTKTALDAIEREAAKAGWTLEAALSESCARGWTGFKAAWVADKPATRQAESFRERDDRLARERYEDATGQRRKVIDITPEFLEIAQ